MSSLPEHMNMGQVGCDIEINTKLLGGKSVIVTGGAKGIGAVYVRALAKGGASVTVGDIDEVSGQKLVAEFPRQIQYANCDVTKWEVQLHLFSETLAASPSRSYGIVIANAGIAVDDAVLNQEETNIPTKPHLLTNDVNMIGVLYTMKLARFHFDKQIGSQDRDRCLILQGSIAAYVDQPGVLQYNASK